MSPSSTYSPSSLYVNQVACWLLLHKQNTLIKIPCFSGMVATGWYPNLIQFSCTLLYPAARIAAVTNQNKHLSFEVIHVESKDFLKRDHTILEAPVTRPCLPMTSVPNEHYRSLQINLTSEELYTTQ